MSNKVNARRMFVLNCFYFFILSILSSFFFLVLFRVFPRRHLCLSRDFLSDLNLSRSCCLVKRPPSSWETIPRLRQVPQQDSAFVMSAVTADEGKCEVAALRAAV